MSYAPIPSLGVPYWGPDYKESYYLLGGGGGPYSRNDVKTRNPFRRVSCRAAESVGVRIAAVHLNQEGLELRV